MDIPYRPLGIIMEIVEQLGLEVTYAYEDLIFIAHNAFLLRMGDRGERVHVYFNVESESDKRAGIEKQLSNLAVGQGLKILNSGTYTMEPHGDDQVDIHFHENEAEWV